MDIFDDFNITLYEIDDVCWCHCTILYSRKSTLDMKSLESGKGSRCFLNKSRENGSGLKNLTPYHFFSRSSYSLFFYSIPPDGFTQRYSTKWISLDAKEKDLPYPNKKGEKKRNSRHHNNNSNSNGHHIIKIKPEENKKNIYFRETGVASGKGGVASDSTWLETQFNRSPPLFDSEFSGEFFGEVGPGNVLVLFRRWTTS